MMPHACPCSPFNRNISRLRKAANFFLGPELCPLKSTPSSPYPRPQKVIVCGHAVFQEIIQFQ